MVVTKKRSVFLFYLLLLLVGLTLWMAASWGMSLDRCFSIALSFLAERRQEM